MKKLLLLLLGGTSMLAFADTSSFQDFDNNAYLQAGNTYINGGAGGQSDGYTLGTTIQTKNNIWINAQAYGSAYNSNNWTLGKAPLGGSTYGQFLATAKAGYAFQFLQGQDVGFQVIPYATFTYGTSLGALNNYYGVGVKPELRVKSFKFSLDTTTYIANQSGGGVIPGTTNPTFNTQGGTGNTSDFRYTINPEVQYDFMQTVMVAVGYAYDQSFNSQPNMEFGQYSGGNSTVYARVGYLF